MADDVREAGLKLVAENSAEFDSALASANSAVTGFGQAAEDAGGGLDILGEIATGALRKIGELAIEGVGKLGSALLDFVKDAMEGEKLLARLESVITATGGAAGLTVTQAQELATQFKDLAGGSDEAVLAIEEMALRMGTVSADQMPGFIQTTLDLAAATGTDAANAARLLAQAYDDPASAMTRFNKMGIRFDTALSEQIKAMVKGGDTAGAFALMMGRLGEATAGAAAGQADTLSGQLGIMKEHLLDAGKSIGEALLPGLRALFDEVIVPAIPIIEAWVKSFAEGITYLIGFKDNLGAIGESILNEWGGPIAFLAQAFGIDIPGWVIGVDAGLMSLWNWFQTAIPAALASLQGIWNSIWPTLQATFASVFAYIQSVIAAALPTITANISIALTQMQIFWAQHGDEVITIVQGLIGFVGIALKVIADTIGATLVFISGLFSAFWALVNGDTVTANQVMVSTITQSMNMILSLVGTDLTEFSATWKYNWDTAGLIVTTVWTNIKDAIAKAIMDLSGSLQAGVIAWIRMIQDMLKVDWGAVGRGIIDGISAGIQNAIGGLASAAAQAAASALDAAKGALGISSPSRLAAVEIGLPFVEGIAQGITGALGMLSGASASASGALVSPPGAAANVSRSTSYSNTNQFNYSPVYSSGPANPAQDFAIMQVMAA